MNKQKTLWIILKLIFLVIFNAVFFVAGGFEHSASVWISYGFIHFAYFMLVLTPFLTRKGKSEAVFGRSLYLISSVYFFVQLAVGVIIILIAPDGIKAALLIQLCMAGFYGAYLISHMLANEKTAEAEEKRQHDIAFVKDASARLKSLLDHVSDKEAKRKVERVFDAIYSSPVKSHPDLAQMERRILDSINELENEIAAGNNDKIISKANALSSAINERNLRLRALN